MTDLPESPTLPRQTYDAPQALIVFDGICVFCSGFVQLIPKLDRENASASPRRNRRSASRFFAGTACRPTITTATFTKLDSFIAAMSALGWPWRATKALPILPRPLRDWLYDNGVKSQILAKSRDG
ncbi:DCC1-like thiol-disulfide oxidoreductase family protein [Mesorhizobium sp.]|uniref:thiol-disulfide oxidoreductase DCC family protein n=1 Tax=Mesorhizobium sp. TaxID=1871066 RepID=UPI000FE55EB8|nr:DCC1-like thiol-disulfide oxidoreductase family protein [Mesorhizobium sp.]RWL58085.1 MAG: DUF393 domain-containing protein [Mesorhizobium sp.]